MVELAARLDADVSWVELWELSGETGAIQPVQASACRAALSARPAPRPTRGRAGGAYGVFVSCATCN